MRKRVETMNIMLHEAAVEGNVTSLMQLLQEDKLVLDRFVVGCFPETPLHISSMLGHVSFVKKIIELRPELTGELDFQRSSPLHLAAAKGHVEIVKMLLLADPDMCLVQDFQGRNPLHVAVIKGRIDVLKELVRARPQSVYVLVDWVGTIFHLCVNHSQLEALKLLVEIIDDNEFLNTKDGDGFTVLHLAIAHKQNEIIRFLVTGTRVEVNAMSSDRFTALDILTNSRRDAEVIEIRESLRQVGALKSISIPVSAQEDDLSVTAMNGASASQQQNWLEQKRNALMVVASLIATMAFQSVINQPEVMVAGSVFKLFILSNSIGFITSLGIILLLVSGLPLKNSVFVWILMVVMWASIVSMGFAYFFALLLLPSMTGFPITIIVFSMYTLVGIILLGHATRLTVKLVKYLRSKIVRDRPTIELIDV